MIWGVVKRKQSVEVIGRKGYSQIKWRQYLHQTHDTIRPRLELSRQGLYQIYQLDDFIFNDRMLEKNDHEYRINFE